MLRKRKGGIKLEGEEAAAASDDKNVELEKQIQEEQKQKKEVQEKKKSDDLWASFMSDVGKRPDKKSTSGSGTSASLTNKVTLPLLYLKMMIAIISNFQIPALHRLYDFNFLETIHYLTKI